MNNDPEAERELEGGGDRAGIDVSQRGTSTGEADVAYADRGDRRAVGKDARSHAAS